MGSRDAVRSVNYKLYKYIKIAEDQWLDEGTGSGAALPPW